MAYRRVGKSWRSGVPGSGHQAGRRKRGWNERAMAAVTETGAEPMRGVRRPRGRAFPFAPDPFRAPETKEAHLAGGPPRTEFPEHSGLAAPGFVLLLAVVIRR